MQELWQYATLSFMSLFVIVDPIGLIPIFLAMTEQNTVRERIRMGMVATCLTLVILLVFALSGLWIFNAFGITLPAFEIAGGIVLLLIGIDMLQAKRTPLKETYEEQAEGTGKSDIAATPLAVPMLAGPGAITMVILLATQAVTPVETSILVLNIFVICLVTCAIFTVVSLQAEKICSVIPIRIMTRLMGLILAAIAVQFILEGTSKAITLFQMTA